MFLDVLEAVRRVGLVPGPGIASRRDVVPRPGVPGDVKGVGSNGKSESESQGEGESLDFAHVELL